MKGEKMRYFLILSTLLIATSAQAGQERIHRPDDVTVPVLSEKLIQPKTPQERPQAAPAEVKHRTDDKTPHANHNPAAQTPPANIHTTPEKPSANSNHKPQKQNPSVHHDNKNNQPHHEPDKKPKKKSGVSVRVNISSGVPVTRSVVTTQPVRIVRPVVYENNIYSNNAYTCRSVNNLKYCTDYLGRALNGKIVQNYGDTVAYEHYQNGYQSGETTVFADDGLLLRKTNYKKSLKHGKETVYHTNGKVEYTANYKKGALDGTVMQYNMNGKQIGRMSYHNGRLQNRSCRYEVKNPELSLRLKQKNYNELILCPDDTRY